MKKPLLITIAVTAASAGALAIVRRHNENVRRREYGPHFPPEMADTLVSAAGELWASTNGDDPYDVLSAIQRAALDRAATAYLDSFREDEEET
jgi:hypothetical protein